MTKHKSIIIFTHRGDGGDFKTPHIQSLKYYNPDIDIHIAGSEDKGKSPSYLRWNSDQFIREWWSKYRKSVLSDVVYLVEWDTLIETTLPKLDEEFDYASRNLRREPKKNTNSKKRKVSKNELLFKLKSEEKYKKNKKPLVENGLPSSARLTIASSFGFHVIRREFLDLICDSKWDDLFSIDYLSEARLPTLLYHLGARMKRINLPYVSCGDVVVGDQLGIYHSVDEPIGYVRKAGFDRAE